MQNLERLFLERLKEEVNVLDDDANSFYPLKVLLFQSKKISSSGHPYYFIVTFMTIFQKSSYLLTLTYPDLRTTKNISLS